MDDAASDASSHKSDKTITGNREDPAPPENPIQSNEASAQILGLNTNGLEVVYDNSVEKKRIAASPPEKAAPGKKQQVSRKNSRSRESKK